MVFDTPQHYLYWDHMLLLNINISHTNCYNYFNCITNRGYWLRSIQSPLLPEIVLLTYWKDSLIKGSTYLCLSLYICLSLSLSLSFTGSLSLTFSLSLSLSVTLSLSLVILKTIIKTFYLHWAAEISLKIVWTKMEECEDFASKFV